MTRSRGVRAVGWISLLAVAACAPAQNGVGGTVAGEQTQGTTVTTDSRVVLERGPCFGTCPVYRVEIAADGTVSWNGERFVEHTGRATASIPADSAASLMRHLDAAGFYDLADRYMHGEKPCGEYHTDAPYVTLTMTLDGRTKIVQHDYGCTGTPEVLRRMHERVDSVAGVERWIGS